MSFHPVVIHLLTSPVKKYKPGNDSKRRYKPEKYLPVSKILSLPVKHNKQGNNHAYQKPEYNRNHNHFTAANVPNIIVVPLKTQFQNDLRLSCFSVSFNCSSRMPSWLLQAPMSRLRLSTCDL